MQGSGGSPSPPASVVAGGLLVGLPENMSAPGFPELEEATTPGRAGAIFSTQSVGPSRSKLFAGSPIMRYFGIHSPARFCASATCSRVICLAKRSRLATAVS